MNTYHITYVTVEGEWYTASANAGCMRNAVDVFRSRMTNPDTIRIVRIDADVEINGNKFAVRAVTTV